MLFPFLRHAPSQCLWVCGMLFVIGCGEPIAKPEPVQCTADEILQGDGTCLHVGLPKDLPCTPGEMQLAEGTCQAAGVPSPGCGPGFVHENQGCKAILPEKSCPFGQMALPGETACREVSSCGEGTWGDIPIEADTQFVDQAYNGNDSDGSQDKPWKTIQEGIDNAPPGGMVAVAAGTYAEDLFIAYKQVRLWGRCPQLVEVSGSGVFGASLGIYTAKARNSEVRGVSITSTEYGLLVSSVENVVLEDLWIHDVLAQGIYVDNEFASTSASINNVLIEKTAMAGAYVAGAATNWNGVVIRDTGDEFGIGLTSAFPNVAGTRSTLHGSMIERTAGSNVVVRGVDLVIEDSLLRDMLPVSFSAAGIMAMNTNDARSDMTLRGCVLERSYGAGVAVFGATALIENTTVRDSQLDSMGGEGNGMFFVDSLETNQRANVTLRASLIERAHRLGIGVLGSDVTIEGVLIRDMLPDGMMNSGECIYASPRGKGAERPKVVVRGSVMDRCRGTGIAFMGSDGTVETTVVRGTSVGDDEIYGRGISIDYFYKGQTAADVTIRSSIIEKNHEFGIFVHGSRAVIESSIIRETEPNKAGFGRGINMQGHPSWGLYSEGFLRGNLLEKNHETGMYIADSNVIVEDSIVQDTKTIFDSLYGDGIVLRYGSDVDFTRVVVQRNARAGIANFSSIAKVLSSTIACNAFDVGGENSEELPFSYDGSSQWRCSALGAADCGTLAECNVRSAGLIPPPTLSSD